MNHTLEGKRMTITEILSKIQQTLKVQKNQFNQFGKYKYRSCEDILEAVKPLLPEYKAALVVSDEMVCIGDRYYIKATAVLNAADNHISAVAYAREPESQKGMSEGQLTGSTSSYARKYALNGLFAIDDTKDADTQDNSYKAPQVSPEPINELKVSNAVTFFKRQIDEDSIEDTHESVKTSFKALTNDEKIAVGKELGVKAPDSNRMYSTILKDYLKFKPEVM